MADQDHAYKLLFSHAEMVRDLLEGFVKEEWLSQLDYESLEKVGSSYISDDLRERSDDIVWRVRQLAADGRLPPVLAIVLYNGAARWRAPEDLAALLQPGPRALERYQPRARYLLIDEGRYGKDELLSLRNLVAALFRLENSRSEEEILVVVRSLLEWLHQPEQASLRRAFVVWINYSLLGRTAGGPVEGVEDLQTMGTLIEARMQEWEQEWLRQGHREGLREGATHVVQRQLRRRFGDLPDWVTARLQGASSDQLDQWAERLLEVDSLEALFESEKS